MTAFESFKNPAPVYRGTDFFMLNGKLEDKELVFQLENMHKQGVQCVIARTYIGLQSDYPGENFKSRVRTICECAKRLGMQIFLQAGYMPEHVLDLPEKYALDGIKLYQDGESIPENEIVLCKYKGITYTSFNSKTFLDLFNEDSVEYYLDQSYNKMWTGFEGYYGDTVVSVWVDEPSHSAEFLPLPKGFFKKFKERFGYDLEPNIYKLFVDDNGYRTVRYHYRKLLQDRMEVCYFKMLREWCNAHGLMASGHLMMEDVMETTIDRSCAIMPYYRYFDIPGIDLLQNHMNSRYSPIVTTTPIQMTSAARQLGSEHLLCEMYGVATQDMTFFNQRYLFDYMALYGINHRSVHGIFYSMHGRSKRTYPPQLNYYQPYFKDLHIMYDYVASVSRFVSLGKPDGEVLVVHPLDSAWCEYINRFSVQKTGMSPSRMDLLRRDHIFHKLLKALSLSNCVFDLGDERSIEVMGRVEGDKFLVGQMTYSTVVLPDLIEIQENTLALLREFSKNGGRVIVMGREPFLVDGFERENVLGGIDCIRALDVAQVEKLVSNSEFSFHSEFYDKTVFIRRRRDKDFGYMFLFNPDCINDVDGVLRIRGTVRAEIWNGFDKSRKSVPCAFENGETLIKLHLAKGESLMLVTEKVEKATCYERVKDTCEVCTRLSNEWNIKNRSHKNVLLLDFCKYKKGNGEYSQKDYPVLALQQLLTKEEYEGELTQRFVFNAARRFENLSLALEDSAEHEIYLNGERVPFVRDGYYFAKDFESVKLPAAKVGENVLEIKRYYKPLSKMVSSIGSLFQTRVGCELESVYLLGDFGVEVVSEAARNYDLRFSRSMCLVDEKHGVCGELTREGYPFFAGEITLEKTFEYNGEVDGEIYLEFESVAACLAHVKLNGKELAAVFCPPYKLCISGALLKGENVLEITLVNTLRNLLGPYHNPKGELENLFGGGYAHQDAAWVGGAANDFQWFENREIDTLAWTDSYMQAPLNVKSPTIKRICEVKIK